MPHRKSKARTEIQAIVTAIEAYDQAYGRFPVSHAAQNAATAAQNGDNDFTYGGNFNGVKVGTLMPGGTILTNNEVIAILMDYTTYPGTAIPTINTNHQSNPQQTKFLNATPVNWKSGDAGPAQPGVGTDLVYRDPWGDPYVISMDLNYDDQCEDAFYRLYAVSHQNNGIGFNGLVNSQINIPNHQDHFQYHGKVMVWSAGPNKKIDPNDPATDSENRDNILSWQ